MVEGELVEVVGRAIDATCEGPSRNDRGSRWRAALSAVMSGIGTVAPTGLDAVQRRHLTSRVILNSDVAHHRGSSGRALDLLAAKLAIRVHDVACGRWDRVPVHERQRLAQALGRPVLVDADAQGRVRAAHATEVVGFAVPYRPSGRGVGDRIGVVSASTRLTTLSEGEAPVACSLRTPDGPMRVRRHGDGYLRPVLSPGSWIPADVETFAEAAATGTAWRDNPFLVRQPRGVPCLSLSDYVDDGILPARAGQAASAIEAAHERAGPLFVIDGIVHRECGPPSVGIVRLEVGGAGVERPYGIAWQVDGLSSVDTMDTLSGFQWGEVDWTTSRAVAMENRYGRRLVAPLRVVDLPMLERAFDEWIPGRDHRTPCSSMPVCLDRGVSLVGDVDPTLLGDGPDGLRMLVDLSNVPDRGPRTDAESLADVIGIMETDARILGGRVEPGRTDPDELFAALAKGDGVVAFIGCFGQAWREAAVEHEPEDGLAGFQP